jgi:hypothetical protein
MKNDIERLYLIDKYLKGELSGLALDEFKSKMRLSPEFAQEVESQRAIIEGIKLARREQLLSVLRGERAPSIATPISKTETKPKEDIPENTYRSVEEPEKEFKLKINYNNWYFAAAAALFTGFSLYFLFGYYLPKQKGELVNIEPVIESTTPEKPKTAEKTEPKIAVEPSKIDSLKIEKDNKLAENTIVVPAYETIEKGKNDGSNVSSGDPENPIKVGDVRKVMGSELKVEYWQSVVNFKGYKLSDTRLLLFDILPEEKISLKSIDDKIYLKRGGIYYKLVASNKFEQYETVSNPDLLKILDSN